MQSMFRSAPPRHLRRLAACLIAGAAGTLVLASTAWAAPSISPGSGQFWNAANPTPTYTITGADGELLTWTASGPGGYSDTGTIVGSGSASPSSFPEGEGTLTAYPTLDPSDASTVSFEVDRVAPSLGATLVGTPNAAGWYRSPFAIGLSPCTDAGSGLPGGACDNQAWTTDGVGLTTTVGVTDRAGNSATAASPTFNFDATPPAAAGGLPSSPTSGTLVATEPEYRWTRGVDPTSGPERYEVEWRTATEDDGNDWQAIARVPDTGLGDYTARRDPALRAAPLPEQELLEWRVRTFDVAGNSRASTSYRLTIDSTIPAPPAITGGPNSPIRFTSPTFSWAGTHETYLWDVTIPGRQNPVRSGGGPETEVTLPSLSDGDYTFSVSQVTTFGQRSEAASRSFKIDTTPPVAPAITIRPPFPAAGTITFGWSAEAGAFSSGRSSVPAEPPCSGPRTRR